MLPWLLVPVKSLAGGKSRLGAVCPGQARRDLNEYFVERVLRTSSRFPGTERTAVISPCEEALRLARRCGAHAIRQTSAGGLNGAAEEGVAALRGLGATGILLIASDEPLLRPSDIRNIAEHGARVGAVVIYPDKRSTGTNAIYLPAGASLRFRFGKDSCRKHCSEALRAGLVPRLRFNPRVAFDIDTPSDLKLWLRERGNRLPRDGSTRFAPGARRKTRRSPKG